jgi:hypothetical protein
MVPIMVVMFSLGLGLGVRDFTEQSRNAKCLRSAIAWYAVAMEQGKAWEAHGAI